MSEIQALILGLVQGLTEYLPVSSSGHLEIGKMLLGPEAEAGGLTFSIVVHVATVLSTLVILWKEIVWILKGLLKFEWNEEAKYTLNILISMIPVGVVGLFFKDQVEALFSSNTVVGVCLLVTAALLTLTHYAKPRQRDHLAVFQDLPAFRQINGDVFNQKLAAPVTADHGLSNTIYRRISASESAFKHIHRDIFQNTVIVDCRVKQGRHIPPILIDKNVKTQILIIRVRTTPAAVGKVEHRTASRTVFAPIFTGGGIHINV